MKILELLGQPEGKTLEFKRDLSSPKNLLKTLVAFANSAGGTLVIGVDDDRQPLGMANPLDKEERLCSLIADSISPRLAPTVEMVTIEEKTLLVVEVFQSNTRPHWLKTAGPEDGVYVRLGSTNRQADRELIAELRRSAEGIAFDETPLPGLTRADLDLTALKEHFGNERSLRDSDLLTLRLLTREQGALVPTRGGVLLFGKERTRHFPDAWVQCGRFVGRDRATIFDHIELFDPLPQAVDNIMLFLKKHAMRSADFSGVRRRDVWSIPLPILREAAINALVHADYSQRGAPIRIAFFDDRIEIENPGILLPGMTIEDMKQGVSRIRNHVIARVFRELRLIEQWGSGVRRVFREAASHGLPEPRIEEIGLRLRFTVWLAKPLALARAVKSTVQQAQSGAQSGAQSISVITALSDTPLSAAEISRMLGLESKSGALKRTLKELLDQGLIEYTIPEKPNSRLQKYRLTTKGTDRLEQEFP